MKHGMFTCTIILAIGLFIAFSPATLPAEEAAPSQPTAQKEKTPPPPPPAPENEAAPQPPCGWKEEVEKRHVEFIEWLQKNYPDKAKELVAIQEQKPEEFATQIGEAMKIYGPIQQADQFSPELAKVLRKDLELQDQRDALIRQLASATPEQQPELLKQLREIVAARFDILIQKKQLFYDHLRERLAKLEKKIEEQAKELEQLKTDKEKSVEERMKELTEQSQTIDWK